MELLLGVDEGLEEEGGGQLSGHDCNVIHGPVTVLVQRGGQMVCEMVLNLEINYVLKFRSF